MHTLAYTKLNHIELHILYSTIHISTSRNPWTGDKNDELQKADLMDRIGTK